MTFIFVDSYALCKYECPNEIGDESLDYVPKKTAKDSIQQEVWKPKVMYLPFRMDSG